jgi:hypothetical protein
MNDDSEDKRAQHQRALLHNAPQPAPRRPQPGEFLCECYSEKRRKFYRFELRDRGQYGFEVQVFDPTESLRASLPASGTGARLDRGTTESDRRGRRVMQTESKVVDLKRWAEAEGVVLPDIVARYIALTVRAEGRELEGHLIRLIAYASLTGQVVSLPLAQEVLANITEEGVH